MLDSLSTSSADASSTAASITRTPRFPKTWLKQKEIKMMTFLVGVLVLAGVLSSAHPAPAQDLRECGYPADTPLPAGPTVTAQQVEDGSASLREFMLAARDRFDESAS